MYIPRIRVLVQAMLSKWTLLFMLLQKKGSLSLILKWLPGNLCIHIHLTIQNKRIIPDYLSLHHQNPKWMLLRALLNHLTVLTGWDHTMQCLPKPSLHQHPPAPSLSMKPEVKPPGQFSLLQMNSGSFCQISPLPTSKEMERVTSHQCMQSYQPLHCQTFTMENSNLKNSFSHTMDRRYVHIY